MFERLGKYFIRDETGAADGVSTHRAYTLSGALVRPVWVRRAQAGQESSGDVAQLLVEEARVGALLDHPNVVRVLDLDQAGGWVLVLERSPGADLATVMNKARLRGMGMEPHSAVYVALQILQALAHAHERTDLEGSALGLVHRDVSPANVFVSFTGEVRLGGFGFARSKARPSPPPPGIPRPRFAYASPEVAGGSELDHRSDLYSLGLILYELLSGTAAYDGRSEPETASRAQRGQIRPLAEVAPAVSPDLRAAVERSLAVDRRQRHPSAAALRDELARHLFLRDPSFGAARLGAFLAQVMGDVLAEERLKEREERAELETKTQVRLPSPGATARAAPAEYPRAWATEPTAAELDDRRPLSPASEEWPRPRATQPEPRPAAPAPARAAAPSSSNGAGAHGLGAIQPAPALSPASPAAPIVMAEPKPLPLGKIALAAVGAALIGLLAFTFSSDSNTRLVQRKLRSAVLGRQPGGLLTVESIPAGARVILDGDDSGKTTPLTVENLESGVIHELRLELAGENAVTSTIAIRAGTKNTTTLIFKDAVVPFSIKSDPPGAEVWMGGRSVALTPASMSLRVGQEAQVKLTKAGYLDVNRAIVPERGKPVELDLKLEMTPEMLEQKKLEDAAVEEAAREEKAAEKKGKKKKR